MKKFLFLSAIFLTACTASEAPQGQVPGDTPQALKVTPVQEEYVTDVLLTDNLDEALEALDIIEELAVEELGT